MMNLECPGLFIQLQKMQKSKKVLQKMQISTRNFTSHLPPGWRGHVVRAFAHKNF